jgi:oligopeptide transport system substrate-binding protein
LVKSTNGNNHTGYNNPEYDALLDQAALAPDLAARSKLLHDAEVMMMADAPVAPVYYYTNNFMLKSYVSGACFSPLGNQFFWNCTITK